MDKRVVIHGTTRTDMNGKCGVATDFHPMDRKDRTTWRYTVRLDSGGEVKLRPERLRAEGEGMGADRLFDLGFQVYKRIRRAVGSAHVWPVLTSEQQSEMGSAVVMLEEAMAQVSDGFDRGVMGLACHVRIHGSLEVC